MQHDKFDILHELGKVVMIRSVLGCIAVAFRCGISAVWVGRSIGLSVCHSSESCKKTDQPIEMPFGLRIGVEVQTTAEASTSRKSYIYRKCRIFL